MTRYVIRSSCLAWVNPGEGLLHAGCRQTHSLLNRGRAGLLCWYVVLCFKAAKEVIEAVQQRDATVTLSLYFVTSKLVELHTTLSLHSLPSHSPLITLLL